MCLETYREKYKVVEASKRQTNMGTLLHRLVLLSSSSSPPPSALPAMSPPYVRNLHSTDHMQKQEMHHKWSMNMPARLHTNMQTKLHPSYSSLSQPGQHFSSTEPGVLKSYMYPTYQAAIVHIHYFSVDISHAHTLAPCDNPARHWHFEGKTCVCMISGYPQSVFWYYSLPLSISVNALNVSENWWWW